MRAATGEVALTVPIAPGELIDKITILEIKAARITDPAKRANVARELAALCDVRSRELPASGALERLTAALKSVNEQLWRIEDAIRECEHADDFGSGFLTLTRSVYRTNDRRAALKRRINDHLGSPIVEEKSYAAYG